MSFVTQEELKQAWEELLTLKVPPEEPLWIDMRYINNALDQTATERIHRLEFRIQMEGLILLADIEALKRAIAILRESAMKNPYWNDGKPIQEWVGDQAVTEAKRKSMEMM